jgi:hypothetical protein
MRGCTRDSGKHLNLREMKQKGKGKLKITTGRHGHREEENNLTTLEIKEIIMTTTTCLNEYYLTKYTVQQTPLKNMLPEDGPMRLKHVA